MGKIWLPDSKFWLPTYLNVPWYNLTGKNKILNGTEFETDFLVIFRYYFNQWGQKVSYLLATSSK